MTRSTPPQKPGDLRQAVLQYIVEHPSRPLKARALARELDVQGEGYTAFRDLLRELLAEGAVSLGPGRSITLPEHSGKIVGVFRANRGGFGFIESPGKPDVFVPRGKCASALDGDTVTARVVKPSRSGLGPAAEITRVLQRAEIRWVGVLERLGAHWVVRPQGRIPTPMVFIDDPAAKSARPGDLVAVEPLERTLDSDSVRGVIIERLGPPGETRTKILGVIRRHGVRDQFPAEVRYAAQQAVASFNDSSFAHREDLRGLLTITIDPPDARDFDDAISIEAQRDGSFRLGVHIADVSHFVREGNALDVEALERGTSVYFPGFVVPMLPELLSNGVCSLQPQQDRLTKSAFIDYDRQARVRSTRFAESVIRSGARLTYQEVTDALAGNPGNLKPEVLDLLKTAEHLARTIRRRRIAEGMLTLHLPELQLHLDADGNVKDAGPADTSFSHTIIEMFMVEANEAVSRVLNENGMLHLRRVHPAPEESDLRSLGKMLSAMGSQALRSPDRAGLKKLVDSVEGQPAEGVVNMLLLRSLTQAYYSPEPLEHYALASDHYCHFTSPIRRYPDLVNHRQLERLLARDAGHARRTSDREHVEPDFVTLGRVTSRAERRAQQAEREAKQLLMLGFMKSRVGQTFDGIISGVTPFGAFVQLQPYLAEGLIRLAEFPRDHWEFDDKRMALVGRSSQRVVMLGQRIRVEILAIDENRMEMSLGAPELLGESTVAKKEPLATTRRASARRKR